MEEVNQPPKMAYRAIRYKTAGLAIKRPPIFHGPIEKNNKSVLVEFKARAQRQGGRNRFDYKAGITGSESRFLQGVQGIVSGLIPGNPSTLRSPIRSRLYSAVTPGGGNIPGVGRPGDGSRGYRCPEGYQYGGRFTDSRFSTCGQKLFEVAAAIAETVAQIVDRAQRPIMRDGVSGQDVRFTQPPGQVITTRAAQIPRVSAENAKAYSSSSDKVVAEMVSFAKPSRRMVRRDGFTLTPVVSSAVLRTVPDNRDMEGANYIQFVDNPSAIGTDDEIGLLSNTGIRKLTYVLPGGSTISIEKARTLTVGERRKLGRTIKTLGSSKSTADPSAHLKALAAEMGSGIAYRESFNVENPNDLIDAVIPGTNNVRQVRRWYYESFLKTAKGKKPDRAEAGIVSSGKQQIEEKITNLQNAIRHLNNNGDISKIDSQILAEAVRRSRIYKLRTLQNGLNVFDKADGQSLIEIPASQNYDHIGAAVTNDVQKYLGLLAPDVFPTGSGTRRSYFLQETADISKRTKINRDTSSDLNNFQDMLRIAVSDFVTDTRDRDLSTIVSLDANGEKRAVSSINRNSALAGLSLNGSERRKRIQMQEFYSEEYLATLRANFLKRSEAQRRIALKLFDAMLARLKQYDLTEMASRLSLDGSFSQAEKTHINLVKTLIETRIEILSKSKKNFARIIGLEI